MVLWDNLEGPDGEEGGSGVQEGGDIWDAFLSLYIYIYIPTWVSQIVLVVKNLPANADVRDKGFNTWIKKIPRRRAWQVFLPTESHGWRSLAGYI